MICPRCGTVGCRSGADAAPAAAAGSVAPSLPRRQARSRPCPGAPTRRGERRRTGRRDRSAGPGPAQGTPAPAPPRPPTRAGSPAAAAAAPVPAPEGPGLASAARRLGAGPASARPAGTTGRAGRQPGVVRRRLAPPPRPRRHDRRATASAPPSAAGTGRRLEPGAGRRVRRHPRPRPEPGAGRRVDDLRDASGDRRLPGFPATGHRAAAGWRPTDRGPCRPDGKRPRRRRPTICGSRWPVCSCSSVGGWSPSLYSAQVNRRVAGRRHGRRGPRQPAGPHLVPRHRGRRLTPWSRG